MIRWSFLLPRLLLVSAMLAALHFGLGPLTRWTLIQGGQAAVGGRVDVGDAQVGLAEGRLSIHDLQVTNPRSPLRNLLQFEAGEFVVAPGDLLHRRLVVERGSLRGLEFDTARDGSGALPESADSDAAGWSSDSLGEAGRQWLGNLADRLDTTLEDELETVRLSRQLMERWSAEYREMESRVRDWQARAEQLRRIISQPPRGNVLEQAEFYRQQLAEVDSLRRELSDLRQRLERLRGQADTDRMALDQARRRDTEHVRAQFRLETLDPESLSEYLLGEETGRMVADAVGWVRAGHRCLNAAGEAPEANHVLGRGRLVNLLPGPKPPDLLIRTLDIEGRFRRETTEIPFCGTARDITHQPRRHDRPLAVQLQLGGAAPGRFSLVVDQRQADPRSRLLLEWPRIDRPGRRLGDAAQLALEVSPGEARMDMELELVGTRLTGRIRCRQEGVELTPKVSSQLGGAALAGPLQTAVGDLRTLELVIPLEGDLPRPRWRLQSNVGGQLAAGFNHAIQQELSHRAEQLRRRADGLMDQQRVRLEVLLERKQSELLAQLQLSERQVDEFKQLVARRGGLPQELLGRELPFGKPFGNLMRK